MQAWLNIRKSTNMMICYINIGDKNDYLKDKKEYLIDLACVHDYKIIDELKT